MEYQIPRSVLEAHLQLNATALTGSEQLQQKAVRLVGGRLCGGSDVSQVSVRMPGWESYITVQSQKEVT